MTIRTIPPTSARWVWTTTRDHGTGTPAICFIPTRAAPSSMEIAKQTRAVRTKRRTSAGTGAGPLPLGHGAQPLRVADLDAARAQRHHPRLLHRAEGPDEDLPHRADGGGGDLARRAEVHDGALLDA